MNPLLFTVALVGLFSLLIIYIQKRLVSHLHLSDKVKKLLTVFLYVNLFGIFLYALGRYFIDFPNWLYFLLSLPIGVLFLLFCTTLLYDISRVVLVRVPLSDERRHFFKRSLDLSSLVVASSITAKAIYEARHVTLEKVNIKLKNLKKPYRILQLSDIHIGGIIDKNFIAKIVSRVNACTPDLVVITGDLVDTDVDKAKEALNELKNLKSKYGTYFIVGNHEYFHNIEKIIATVKSLGIKVLENENLYIGEQGEGFNLVGVYDLFGYRVETHTPNITLALQKRDEESPTVLLAHQPKFIEEVPSGVDLMLSGHTHGGQLYPFKALVKLQQGYVSGLHQHSENLQIYINKGTGFWGPPMRIGASAEITEITIS
ncbi:MAG: metallophosphoesterase [Campylobacterota bacterium]|nr:metallophosphoesterase [Campylobacterota bacterium]